MKKALLLSAALASSAISAPAFAQDSESDQLLDVVVTTAQRRTQNILDVPIAVSTLDAAALEAAGVVDILDLNLAVPSMFSNSLSSPLSNFPVRIRGIGTGGGNPGFESAVGMYVDEIYRSRPGAALTSFYDMAGVDVLRGPQGTLFGKNTTAGAITMRTAAPNKDEFEAYLQGSLGNYGTQSVEGMFNVALENDAAFRLSALHSQTDGFFSNPITGEDTAGNENLGFRAQFAFEPGDNLDVRLMADYSRWQEQANYGRSTRIDNRDLDGRQNAVFPLLAFNLVGPVGGQNYWYWDASDPANPGEADPFARDIVVNQVSDQDLQQWGVSATVNYDLGDNLSLKSITSYREVDSGNLNGDWDFGPVGLAGVLDVYQDFETLSQEFLLDGDLGENLEFLAGVHYFNEDILLNRQATVGDAFAFLFTSDAASPVNGVFGNTETRFQDIEYDHTEESYGVFGHLTYALTDQIDLIGGLRWNKIDKSVEYENQDGLPAADYFDLVQNNVLGFLFADAAFATAFPWESDLTNEELSYNATLQYRPNADMQLYASYSRGFKAGGYNLTENAAAGEPSLPVIGRFDPTNPNTVLVPGANAGIGGVVSPFGPGRTFAPFTPDAADFAPEFVDSYEVGLRWEYGGRGRLSLTGFYSDFTDLQVSVFNGLTFEVVNAGTSDTKGVEFENTFAVNENLTLNLSGTIMDTSYGEDAGTISTGLPAGRSRGLAPDVALVAGVQYETPISDSIDLYSNLNYSYYSEMFLAEGNCRDATGQGVTFDECSSGALALDPDNQLTQATQDAYGVFGASLGFRAAGNWDISAFCRNCFDEEFFTYAFNQPFLGGGAPMGNPGDPATYGVRLKKTFN